MIKYAAIVFLLSSIARGACSIDNPIVRLDDKGGSLENFKTIDQDGMGICYSSVATVLLKSAYPDKETLSQIDLAMKYAKKHHEPEESLRQFINGGHTHKAFNLALSEKICRASDINFEVASNEFGSRAMKVYFDNLQSFKDSFDLSENDKGIYFNKLTQMTKEIEKQCQKPHDTLIRRSIKNAYHSLNSFYELTKDEISSLETINDELLKSLSNVETIEDDSKKYREKKDDLLLEINNLEAKGDEAGIKRKKNRLLKVEKKLAPFEQKLEQIKLQVGRNLFPPSTKLLSVQMKSIIEQNRIFIEGLRPELVSSKKDLDEIAAFKDNKLILSTKVNNYLQGEFQVELKKYSSSFQDLNAIDEDKANDFYNRTLRQKFGALDEFYHSPSGTLLDFKMNNPFYCAKNYYRISLDLEESDKQFYSMCTMYEKNKMDQSSYNALTSLLESGSNMDKLFDNINGLVTHLQDISSVHENDVFKKAEDYLVKECSEKVHFSSSKKKKSKAVYFGVDGGYEEFKTKLSQKKKVLKKYLNRSLAKGHAIGFSIAGKMLKTTYNAYEEERKKSLTTDDFEHGLHAVALIGVDCSQNKKKYLIQNSWGTSCLGVKDISQIKCEEGTGRLWIEEDYLLNNTRYLSVIE